MYQSLGMQMNTQSLLMQVIGVQIGIWVDELYHVPLSFLCLGSIIHTHIHILLCFDEDHVYSTGFAMY
jgi:hypothetical protein